MRSLHQAPSHAKHFIASTGHSCRHSLHIAQQMALRIRPPPSPVELSETSKMRPSNSQINSAICPHHAIIEPRALQCKALCRSCMPPCHQGHQSATKMASTTTPTSHHQRSSRNNQTIANRLGKRIASLALATQSLSHVSAH